MPNEWKSNTSISIYKNDVNILNYTNYHGIKLISHTMKLWEGIIKYRLYLSK